LANTLELVPPLTRVTVTHVNTREGIQYRQARAEEVP